MLIKPRPTNISLVFMWLASKIILSKKILTKITDVMVAKCLIFRDESRSSVSGRNN